MTGGAPDMPDPPLDPLAVVRDPSPEGEPLTESLAQTAAEIERVEVDAPRVSIVVAEREDLLILDRAETELQNRGITCEVRVMSADEEPRAVAEYTENAQLRGIRVIIAGAGPRARLPSLISAHTELPVVGVPLTSRGARAGRLDALLSERPASGGEPVAWVGLDDAVGAATLAARILAAQR
jgi:5-(carboxyamino)imidazole ribonucleotide mutase